jgi:hypothetical protein
VASRQFRRVATARLTGCVQSRARAVPVVGLQISTDALVHRERESGLHGSADVDDTSCWRRISLTPASRARAASIVDGVDYRPAQDANHFAGRITGKPLGRPAVLGVATLTNAPTGLVTESHPTLYFTNGTQRMQATDALEYPPDRSIRPGAARSTTRFRPEQRDRWHRGDVRRERHAPLLADHRSMRAGRWNDGPPLGFGT